MAYSKAKKKNKYTLVESTLRTKIAIKRFLTISSCHIVGDNLTYMLWDKAQEQ